MGFFRGAFFSGGCSPGVLLLFPFHMFGGVVVCLFLLFLCFDAKYAYLFLTAMFV